MAAMRASARSALLLALIALPAASPVKVATISFEELVRKADAIVVGTVERVAVAGETRGARLRVEETLAGEPVEALAFVACGTWTCDITTATLGERVLLFLRRPSAEQDSPGRSGPGSPADRAALARELQAGALRFVCHSGRGRMPVHASEAGVHVQAYGDIRGLRDGWPDSCTACAWRHDKLLADVLASIRSILEQPVEPAGR